MDIQMTFSNETETEFDAYEAKYLRIAEEVFAYLKADGIFLFETDLVGEETIHRINREYRGIDRVTDVISFAFEDDDDLASLKAETPLPRDLGQILVCVPVARKQAEEYGHSLDRELSFLFTHGLLHLLGYDHMTKEEEAVMFSIQDEIMDRLKI